MFCRLQSILSEGVPSPLSRTQRGPAQHPKQDGFESYEKKRFWVLCASSKSHLMTSVSVVVSAVLGVWLRKQYQHRYGKTFVAALKLN